MEKLKLTKHNFTLEQDEYDYLSWRSSEELRTINNALRMALRELYNINKASIVAWKARNGKPVVFVEDMDPEELAAQWDRQQGIGQ